MTELLQIAGVSGTHTANLATPELSLGVRVIARSVQMSMSPEVIHLLNEARSQPESADLKPLYRRILALDPTVSEAWLDRIKRHPAVWDQACPSDPLAEMISDHAHGKRIDFARREADVVETYRRRGDWVNAAYELERQSARGDLGRAKKTELVDTLAKAGCSWPRRLLARIDELEAQLRGLRRGVHVRLEIAASAGAQAIAVARRLIAEKCAPDIATALRISKNGGPIKDGMAGSIHDLYSAARLQCGVEMSGGKVEVKVDR